MKKIIAILSLLLAHSAHAQEKPLNLELPKGDQLRIQKVEEKVDERGQVYYDVSINFPLFPLPHDVTGAVGISSKDKRFESELYAGLRVSRLISEDRSVHIPYGARVRVALDSASTIYLEYQHQDIVTGGKEAGLLEMKSLFSVIKFDRARKRYIGCGYSRDTHHAWSDENHPPEKGSIIMCRAGMRF